MSALDLLLDAIDHAREALAAGDPDTADAVLSRASDALGVGCDDDPSWVSAASLGLLGDGVVL